MRVALLLLMALSLFGGDYSNRAKQKLVKINQDCYIYPTKQRANFISKQGYHNKARFHQPKQIVSKVVSSRYYRRLY